MRSVPKVVVASLVATVLMLAGAGVARAVSGGGYNPGQQDCPPNADASTNPNATPGCHSLKVSVEDAKGKRYVEVGVDQMPWGNAKGTPYPTIPDPLPFTEGYPGSPNFPHAGCVAVNTAGTGGASHCGAPVGGTHACALGTTGTGVSVVFDTETAKRNCIAPSAGDPRLAALLASLQGGVNFYFGADDNLDGGEHDGATGQNQTVHSINGPSDGGAVTAHVTPGAAGQEPSATNPIPLVGASEGFCADGFCQEVTTQRQAVYRGGSGSSRDVANYDRKTWDPYNCSSGDPRSEKACSDPSQGGHPGGMDYYHQQEAGTVYAEPGVQVYEDPDPQGSPIDPLYEGGMTGKQTPLYPIPGAYVGTCGLVAGGGPLASAPHGTPLANSKGQLVISPTHC